MRHLSIAVIAAASTVACNQMATAADMPVKAPVQKASVVVPYNWTGFYIGANIGGGWGSSDVDFSPNDPIAALFSLPPTSLKISGVLGGLQVGYNWQVNRNWLIGIETDFTWSDMGGSASSGGIGPTFPITATVDERIKWFGTVRARVGYLPSDNLLAYVTGGFAYGKVQHSGSLTNDSALSGYAGAIGGFSLGCLLGPCFAGSSSDTATGWTAGGGLEYALWNNLTVKAEYLYVSLDSDPLTVTALGFVLGTTPSSFNANFDRTNFSVARVGFNYRF